MSIHVKNIQSATTQHDAHTALLAVIEHPNLTGKSRRRLERAYSAKVAELRSEASRKAAVTRRAKPAKVTRSRRRVLVEA